jgi:hypothetical protein
MRNTLDEPRPFRLLIIASFEKHCGVMEIYSNQPH